MNVTNTVLDKTLERILNEQLVNNLNPLFLEDFDVISTFSHNVPNLLLEELWGNVLIERCLANGLTVLNFAYDFIRPLSEKPRADKFYLPGNKKKPMTVLTRPRDYIATQKITLSCFPEENQLLGALNNFYRKEDYLKRIAQIRAAFYGLDGLNTKIGLIGLRKKFMALCGIIDTSERTYSDYLSLIATRLNDLEDLRINFEELQLPPKLEDKFKNKTYLFYSSSAKSKTVQYCSGEFTFYYGEELITVKKQDVHYFVNEGALLPTTPVNIFLLIGPSKRREGTQFHIGGTDMVSFDNQGYAVRLIEWFKRHYPEKKHGSYAKLIYSGFDSRTLYRNNEAFKPFGIYYPFLGRVGLEDLFSQQHNLPKYGEVITKKQHEINNY